MSNNITTQDPLISAICNLSDNRPLNENQRKAYSQFMKEYSLDDFVIKGQALTDIATSIDRAIEVWPDFEAKLNNLLTLANAVPDIATKESSRFRYVIWRGIAAACLLTIIGVLSFYYYKVAITPKSNTGVTKADLFSIRPGSNKATLTLSDNEIISLDTLENGQVLQDGVTRIEKMDSGSVYYQRISSIKKNGELNNTLTTQRAGTFRIKLSDGTIVFLNAQSSLSYPVTFSETTREVQLNNGEAYFEVAPGTKPFIVKYKETQIKVLGTKFDINTYNNENSIKATLLEGSIQLTASSNPVTLKPSQQAVVSNAKVEIRNMDNPENTISWTKGNFSFEKLTLKEIMYQVERWYDVTVIFEEEPDPSPITVRRISRQLPLNEFLDALKEGGRFSYSITPKKEIIIKK